MSCGIWNVVQHPHRITVVIATTVRAEGHCTVAPLHAVRASLPAAHVMIMWVCTRMMGEHTVLGANSKFLLPEVTYRICDVKLLLGEVCACVAAAGGNIGTQWIDRSGWTSQFI